MNEKQKIRVNKYKRKADELFNEAKDITGREIKKFATGVKSIDKPKGKFRKSFSWGSEVKGKIL